MEKKVTFNNWGNRMAGSKAGSLWQSKRAVELSNGPKELYVIEGAGHFDLYDNQMYIDMAVSKMVRFFNGTLK